MSHHRALALVNVVTFVMVLVANGLANLIPIGGKTTAEVSDLYPNLFAPTGFTFAIWGLIYALLGVFVIYQMINVWWQKERRSDYLVGVGPWFALSNLANAAWIVAWHYQYILLSTLLIFALFLALARVYSGIHNRSVAYTSTMERFIVQVPFRVYFGWISVALIANITVFLVDIRWGGWGLSDVFWTVAMLLAGTCLALVMLAFRRDTAYAAVVVWALGGIAFRHLASDPPLPTVGWAAVLGAVVITLAIGVMSNQKQRQFAG